MKYPRMPEKYDRRLKILPSQRLDVIKRWRQTRSFILVAKEWGVSATTIYLIVNPLARERNNERARKRNKELRKTGGKNFLMRERKRNSERRKYHRSVDFRLQKYYNEIIRNKKYYIKANKIKWQRIKKDPKRLLACRIKHMLWSEKNREYVNKKHRENYRKRANEAEKQ